MISQDGVLESLNYPLKTESERERLYKRDSGRNEAIVECREGRKEKGIRAKQYVEHTTSGSEVYFFIKLISSVSTRIYLLQKLYQLQA